MADDVKKYILLSEKTWHSSLFEYVKEKIAGQWKWISTKDGFDLDLLNSYDPDFIFIPHWSYVISKNIFDKYTCIVFHMTDLPYGRGGSPLQNLIVRGCKETRISAIKVTAGIDEGPVYLKRPLALDGSAGEIFTRSTVLIAEMIIEIVNDKPEPREQKGEPTLFKRRRPEESNVALLEDIEKLYDHIRMLDADGYPNAFIETDHFRMEFTKADFSDQEKIIANVRITKK